MDQKSRFGYTSCGVAHITTPSAPPWGTNPHVIDPKGLVKGLGTGSRNLGLVLTHSSRLGATWGGELVIRLSWHGAMT